MKIKKMLLSSIRPVAGQMYSAQEKRLWTNRPVNMEYVSDSSNLSRWFAD
jgi:hypothetical protein